ncbi:MAG TPA: hypothetical protein V6C52_12995 [Coleofasciculaceae cyanobacterium]|jgi:hypothetical protein
MYRTDYDPQTINNLLLVGMFIIVVAIAIIVAAMQQQPSPVGAATLTSPTQISMDRTWH